MYDVGGWAVWCGCVNACQRTACEKPFLLPCRFEGSNSMPLLTEPSAHPCSLYF